MDVVEKQFRRILRMPANFFQIAAAVETLAPTLYYNKADTAGTLFGIGLARDDYQIRHLAIGDEHFLPIDDKVIAITQRRRLDPLQV